MMWVLMFNSYFVEFSLMISFRCGIRPALPQDQPGCSVYLFLCIPSHFTARNLVRRKGKIRLMCIYSMKYLFSPCCTIKYLGLVIPTDKCPIFIIHSFRRRAPFVVPRVFSASDYVGHGMLLGKCRYMPFNDSDVHYVWSVGLRDLKYSTSTHVTTIPCPAPTKLYSVILLIAGIVCQLKPYPSLARKDKPGFWLEFT